MGNDQGSFAFTGQQRSYSFPLFHGDRIPNSLVAIAGPDMECEQVFLRNSVNSSGNIIVGGPRLAETGVSGVTLEPGDYIGWVPIKNVNLVWHLDAADSYLEYLIIR